jgi:hypothetical protein
MVTRTLSIIAVMLLSGCVGYEPNYVDVTIVNESGEPVRAATLIVAGERYELRDLPSDGREVISFATAGDDSYDLRVQFSSGRVLHNESIGYIGEGMRSRDALRIRPSSIEVDAGTRPEAEAPLPLTPTAPQ